MAEAELIHGGFIRVVIRPMARRGVFHVTFEFERPDTPVGVGEYKANTKFQYPNGSDTLFIPWLWKESLRFGEYLDAADVELKAPQGIEG